MFTITHGVFAVALAASRRRRTLEQLTFGQFILAQICCFIGATFTDYPLIYNILGNVSAKRHALDGGADWVQPWGNILHSMVVLFTFWVIGYALTQKNKTPRTLLNYFTFGWISHITVDMLTHVKNGHAYMWPLEQWFPSLRSLIQDLAVWDYHPLDGQYRPRTLELMLLATMVLLWFIGWIRYLAANTTTRKLETVAVKAD